MAAAGIRRRIGIGIAVAVLYVLAATLGFRVAFAAEQVTTVWAPTGLAQATLLLGGIGLWPAVWIGALLANAGTGAPLWTAVLIATGNTLEAVAAAWMLSRLPGFDPVLRRTRDGLAFIVLAAGVSTAISATVGVTTLCAAAVQPWARFLELWSAWWLGDALGSLVVAPVILTAVRGWRARTRREWIEAAALIAVTLLVTRIVFGQALGAPTGHHPLEYAIVPFLIAAAVRLAQPATALVVLGASAVAIWHTVHGAGPFAAADVQQSLVLLQVFTGMLAATGLLLAAATDERRDTERRRAVPYAVGEVLVDAPGLEHAAPQVLRAIGEQLRWPFGALWVVDDGTSLRCLTVWQDGAMRLDEFARATTSSRFARGTGLPGRVWAAGTATWIRDVVDDPNFPRAPAARSVGLHGAFAFPIHAGHEVIGIIEFLQASVMTPDLDLLQTMSTVGHQVGQFMARKRVEDSAAEAQRRTHAMLNTALDAIIAMDHRGRITEFNPAAERIFGCPRSQAVGRDLADLLIPPALRERHREGLLRYLATGDGPFIDRRIETSACHADGHEFPVEVSITRVPGEDPPIFTGFVRDLTARMEAERERDDLLQRELAARREAEAASRAKDEFLATLSHELRTPLNAIVGWSRMLLDGSLDRDSATRALQVIARNAHLQAQLVEDILDASRIVTGGLQLDVRPIDLGSVIGAALDAVRPAADARRIRLRSSLAASSRLMEGDPKRLQQIVWNLLSNAVKFTPAGGLVDVEVDEAGEGRIRLVVRDNGEGIDASFLPHVFERFRQADGSVTRRHGGLGLGLAIVRHLVELHGGTVRAESAGPGRGATFVVEFPALDPAAASALDAALGGGVAFDPAPFSQTAPLAGCHALVVDDDEEARTLLATILSRAGADVVTASTTREALARVADARPDVLLADVGMPGADGYALIRAIRRREDGTGRRLPAAAVTAYASPQDGARVLAAGFDRHVAKPVVPAEFVRTVMALCGRGDDAPPA